MPRTVKIVLGVLGGMAALLVGLILLLLIVFLLGVIAPESQTDNQLAVIDVSGMITSGSGVSSQASATEINEHINQIKYNENIKGIILRINSPGGSAAASDSIYREILRYKEKTGNPVLASFEDVAASGGYYIASAADEIYANRATTTGSIGVIFEIANLEELYDKIGIEHRVFKSGTYKDMGNPGRELSPEEEKIMQSLVDQVHQQFVDSVVKGRGMGRDKVEALADGRVFTGADAVELDLVDGIGTFYENVERLEDLANLDESHLVYLTKTSFIDIILGTVNDKLEIISSLSNMGFKYQLR